METKAASLNLKLRRGGKLRNSMSFSAYNFTWPSSDMGEVRVLPQWISTGPWQTSHSLLVSSAKLEQAPCSEWKWGGVARFLWDTACQGFHGILPGCFTSLLQDPWLLPAKSFQNARSQADARDQTEWKFTKTLWDRREQRNASLKSTPADLSETVPMHIRLARSLTQTGLTAFHPIPGWSSFRC